MITNNLEDFLKELETVPIENFLKDFVCCNNTADVLKIMKGEKK
jgi:hypothetical protein